MILTDFVKLPKETERQFIWRIGEAKTNGVIDASWDEIAGVINKLWREDETEYRSESAYRKIYAAAKAFYDEVFICNCEGAPLLEPQDCVDLKEQLREIEKARVQLRDERNAYRSDLRAEARLDQKFQFLGDLLEAQGAKRYQPIALGNHDDTIGENEKVVFVVLSDWHIGLAFDNNFGFFNTEVAKDRLSNLLNQTREIAERHNAHRCYVAVVGDLISGNIHIDARITNRENIIEQVQTVTEMLSDVIYQLANIFEFVDVHGVAGNHSRIDSNKAESLKDERLDSLILWMVSKLTTQVQNVQVYAKACDSTVDVFPILGRMFVICHGDYDKPNTAALARLSLMLGFTPYAVVTGHMHYPMLTEVNGAKWIQGGSLCGSGDDYTVQKRLSGNASQTVLVCDKNGIECEYPVRLK